MSGVVSPDGRVISPTDAGATYPYHLVPFPSPPGIAACAISCTCGRQIFDGRVIKARVVDVVAGLAKCRSCKAWVRVPIARKP